MKKLISLGLVMLFTASPSFAKKIFKYTDSSGKTHYSDSKVEGAEEITLPPMQTYEPPEQPQVQNQGTPEQPILKEVPIEYKLAIIKPDNDYVVPNGIEELEVAVTTEPALYKDDYVQWMFDGKPIGHLSQNLSYMLKDELTRGTHTIKAMIVKRGAKTEILNESSPIKIHVHRPIVPANSPNRAP